MPRKQKTEVRGRASHARKSRYGYASASVTPSPAVDHQVAEALVFAVARAGETLSAGADHCGCDPLLPAVVSSAETQSAAGLLKGDAQLHHAASADLQIDAIRYWHRQRCYAMEQRKRAYLALGAFIRTSLGWSLNKPEDERKAIAKRAADMLDNPEGSQWEAVIVASKAAVGPFEAIESRSLKEMGAVAKTLPVWESFGEPIRGFGLASLGVILAEAGDLSLYANPGKLWKRMGLAVMGDTRQGGLPKNATKEEWIAHGYNRQRRSRMWNIGDALIKSNQDGEYRTLYLARKEYELARDPDMKPIKAHRRAQRYMEKRLLKNLWQAWRRASSEMESGSEMPDTVLSAQAEPQATVGLAPILGMPAALTSEAA